MLFYQALALFAEGLGLWVALGARAAAVALVVVGYAILKLGKRLPLKPMLTTGAAMLLLLSVTFAGNAVRSLQEADWIGVTPVDGGWARLPVYVAELTGIHPTREGLTVQAALLVIYVLGAAWVFGVRPWRRRPQQAVARVSGAIWIGVDVGGTFTKAVAVESAPLRLLAHAVVPTTHEAAGVAEGVAAALRDLLAQLGEDRCRVELVAFSTTQAMNALLEGDVGARRRPRDRLAARAPRGAQAHACRIGRARPRTLLETLHAFVDATGGLDQVSVDAALETLAAPAVPPLAVSGAFAVDEPGDEHLVARCAQARGLPACAGHELTGAYGLETRTVTAAINASILPIVERTAALVEEALADAGLDVPLLVLRGDGGAMSIDASAASPASRSARLRPRASPRLCTSSG